MIHLKRSDSTVDAIIRVAFPSYNGSKISDTVTFSGTSWGEGSKSDYMVVSITTPQKTA